MTDETKAATFEVLPKQTFVPCAAPSQGQSSKPFVVWSVHGDQVKAWDPSGGQRLGGFRWIARRNLHESGTTKQGKERKTGWRLQSGPPTEGQELCGSCMNWFDLNQFDKTAWTYGHSTCRPCLVQIEERYGKITP